MAGFDEVVNALEEIKAVLEEIRDAGSGGGGGGGSAGGVGPGKGKGSSLATDIFGDKLTGGFSTLSRGVGLGAGFAGAAFSAANSLGVGAGREAFALGASSGESFDIGGRAGVRNLVGASQNVAGGFFSFATANVANELQAQDRAQGNVSSIAERVARAGGQIDDAGIRSALGRQNEIEGRVQEARNRVAQIQGSEGRGRIEEAAGKDALGPLVTAIYSLVDTLKTSSGGSGVR